MNFHEPEVNVLTYFISHPGYWGGLIVVIFAAAFLRTMANHWNRTGKRQYWQVGLYLTAFLLFVVSGITVLYYKVCYLAMFWN